MANDPSLPSVRTPLLDAKGFPADAWRKFFERLSRLAAESTDAGLQAQITALAAQVAALEAQGGSLAALLGENGITIFGQITDPVVRIRLTAYLGDLLNVDETTVPPAEGDRLTWDATLALWKPAPDPPSVAVLPLVTGEIDGGQPVFVYADDGSLIYTEIE
jgi:hypothetical protein